MVDIEIYDQSINERKSRFFSEHKDQQSYYQDDEIFYPMSQHASFVKLTVGSENIPQNSPKKRESDVKELQEDTKKILTKKPKEIRYS